MRPVFRQRLPDSHQHHRNLVLGEAKFLGHRVSIKADHRRRTQTHRLRRLIEHNLDLALRNGPLMDSNLRSRALVRSQRIICAAPGYWDAHGRPNHPEQLTAHNCLILHRPGVPFSTWPFIVDGKPIAVRVAGNRIANDGGVLRHWAVQGHGVMIKNRWEVRREIEAGLLETVLDEFVPAHVDLYAVTTGRTSSRRVSALVDFLAEELHDD